MNGLKEFKDLVFDVHPSSEYGRYKTHATMFFNNGYGVSVITGGYGREGAPYEMAILFGDKSKNEITYSTGITEDVLGWLTADDVSKYMKKVQELST